MFCVCYRIGNHCGLNGEDLVPCSQMLVVIIIILVEIIIYNDRSQCTCCIIVNLRVVAHLVLLKTIDLYVAFIDVGVALLNFSFQEN